MIVGTSHFPAVFLAIAYYKDYGFDAAAVNGKIASGEITIGAPNLKPGEKLITIDNGRRYGITSESKP